MSGQTYFYPAFNAAKSEDAIKFAHEFSEVIAMPIMLEAVIHVRTTKGQPLEFDALFESKLHWVIGLRMATFHGNFFVWSTDLLALSAVPQYQSYCIEIQIKDTLTQSFVVLQTAVLHSTCTGGLPITQSSQNFLQSWLHR